MIRFSFLQILRSVFLNSLLCLSVVLAQSKADYAHSLMLQGDYFRAISVYKELSYFSHDTDSTVFYQMQIGKAYRLSEKYDLSISTFASILNRYPLSKNMFISSNLNLGLAYLGLQAPAQALPFLQEARSKDSTGLSLFYLGLVNCEFARWETAKAYYDTASRVEPRWAINQLSSEFSKKLARSREIPNRSPLLAGVLSAVFPGAGQAYSGHLFDAAQSFAYVASFAFVSYIAYKNDRQNGGNHVLTGISVSITALFHLANIVGAERTAAYFNQRQKDLFMQDIHEKSLSFDF